VEEAKTSNLLHRPMAIGVQGMADLFAKMKIAFDDPEAMQTNRKIFECLYHAALTESIELSKLKGPYSSFKGSPLSKGILSFDMWDKTFEKGYQLEPTPR